MQKVIENAVLKITKEMEKNRKAYVEAEEWFMDTGCDRYFNKMNKLETDYNELKSFLGIDRDEKMDTIEAENVRLYSENKELRKFIKDVKSQMEYIHADYWSDPNVVKLHEKFKDFGTLN